MESKYDDLRAASSGEGGRGGLNLKIIGDFFVSIPSYTEQQKIADFLSTVDEKITLKQKKYDALVEAKKGLLQKIFSREIRFKKNNGGEYPEWKEIVLSDLFTECKVKNRPEEEVLTIIQGKGTVKRSESGRKIQYDEKSLPHYKHVLNDQFIIHLRSFEAGLEIANSSGIVSPAYHILQGHNMCPRFYYPYFRSHEFINNKLSSTVVGIRDGKSIDMNAFWEIEVPYPSIDEQQKIADFLSAFDEKIDVVRKELEEWKNIKKGLLQQMFC